MTAAKVDLRDFYSLWRSLQEISFALKNLPAKEQCYDDDAALSGWIVEGGQNGEYNG